MLGNLENTIVICVVVLQPAFITATYKIQCVGAPILHYILALAPNWHPNHYYNKYFFCLPHTYGQCSKDISFSELFVVILQSTYLMPCICLCILGQGKTVTPYWARRVIKFCMIYWIQAREEALLHGK